MTIDEAIKILSSDLIPNYPYSIGPKARAIQLGIGALKVVKEFRTGRYKTINSPLPGETE